MIQIPFNNRYVNLGEEFYARTRPAPVIRPTLIKFNEELATAIGMSPVPLDPDTIAAVFSGNVIPEGAEPLAMAYSGHQFGHFNPSLGDGRAILLGEVTGPSGANLEVQLKGSGQTQFSRNGDGRAALGPVLREYLVSEAMEKLGVPTTRALAAVATGEEVARERPLPGGVITRVARSFVRVGTFQYFAMRGDEEAVKKLADHVIGHVYPEAAKADNPYQALLKVVVDRQASLIAQWMQLGFIHGVMNTDNMSIAGETIDYGPCAFMDAFDHNRVFSSIDRDGRYAYHNQPGIGLWNLTRLAESLVPLLADTGEQGVVVAQEILQTYVDTYIYRWLTGMRAKLGLTENVDDAIKADDKSLVEALLVVMEEGHADFTLTFSSLSQLGEQPGENDGAFTSLFDDPAQADEWLAQWRQRLSHEPHDDKARQSGMRAVNPVYIPRNHQIEAAIRAAEDHGDFSVFHELHEVLQNPFTVQSGKERYKQPPEPEEVVTKTFCGT
ncbi:MAG: hypothetical protein AMJ68_03700 [Acidithiobacillales bacterium SG8_45]|jgi:uncharacterized protein YdiU (UPF0061 family)|nr:MAG: hypothetical protein AMJ68_03700 [Acidithiobacillales bacterium SG8_45]